jgi:hypothetical protein
MPASVAATTPIVITASTTMPISGRMYGHRRLRTVTGDVLAPSIGLRRVFWVSKAILLEPRRGARRVGARDSPRPAGAEKGPTL